MPFSVLHVALQPVPPFDLAHLWQAMGPFARAVVGVLAALSAYSLGVTAERLIVFARARRASRRFASVARVAASPGRCSNQAIKSGIPLKPRP